MSDLIRASDITEAMAQIKVLNGKLNSAFETLKMWQLQVDCEIEQPSHNLKVRVSKPLANAGFIKTIPFDEVLYYSADVEALVDIIIKDTVEQLFRNTMRNEIGSKVANAVKNIVTISQKAR